MKALKIFGLHDLRVVDKPVPQPAAGYVRVKIKASGICGSDKWMWNVDSLIDDIGGHEVSGEIDAVGEGVTSLTAGDRVMVNNVVGCGKCPACRMGAFVMCPYWEGKNDVGNGFGEYLVAPERNCMRLLPCIDYIDGALLMDNWGTPYGGLLRAGIKPGMDVLVNGCGPIGQAAIALCASMGAYVAAVDPIQFRRTKALANGAKLVFSPDELPSAAHDFTEGMGVHAVFECSGKGASYENCLKALRIGGCFVAIGENAKYMINSSEWLIRKNLTVYGSWYSTMPQANEVMHLAMQKRIDARAFLTNTITIDEAPKIFGDVVNCADGIIKCVVVFD